MDHNNSNNPSSSPCIIWSCIARNDMLLVEAGTDPYNGLVSQTAKELLLRPITPGYEFHKVSGPGVMSRAWNNASKSSSSSSSSNLPPVRGIKFHVYESIDENDPDYNHFNNTAYDTKDNFRIWIFACVYNTTLIHQNDVQAFLDKMVELTLLMRETSLVWKTCGTLGLQKEFACILQQRMYEIIPHDPKIQDIQEKLLYSYTVMSRNIEMILDNHERIESLNTKSEQCNEMANAFRKRSRALKRMKMWQNAKYGMILGTAVTVGVGIIVIPPLVAIL